MSPPSSKPEKAERANQRRRARKDLLQAAARLMRQGRKPSFEEVAEEALVSRATAYRYFPNIESLLLEAALDLAEPEATELCGADAPEDAVARLERVDAALHEMILANETPLRIMLANTLERGPVNAEDGTPTRQNRRTPLIQAALAPMADRLEPAALERLTRALALVIGIEAMIVFKDVLQLHDAEAREVKRWAIRALVEAARAEK
ncbi:TetR/AcrR family transcriptional regulator [Methylosinus sp. Ce-a6]|uniref:TetR/AcrR family transcriptional regulator n=1 Tax=Methylosinus sp. Ce-a6 TaxID=2172005 RepID=UPI001FCEFA9F|nr:TetR/AcrR family transcriptional regulator [Methylosinus sp. Ce-a6]